MKSNRQKGDAKAEKELKDIIAAIDYLTEAKKMPLVLATAGQIQRGPKALGSVEPGASMGDLVSKIAALESCMTKFMESVNDKFKGVTDDIAKQKTYTDSSIKTVIKEVKDSFDSTKAAVTEELNKKGTAKIPVGNLDTSTPGKKRKIDDNAVPEMNQFPPLSSK